MPAFDAPLDQRPVLAHELAAFALQQQLAHAFLDHQSDAAMLLRRFGSSCTAMEAVRGLLFCVLLHQCQVGRARRENCGGICRDRGELPIFLPWT